MSEHETYDTGYAVLELPAGRIEITHISSPESFATDRKITQAEYDSISECLRQMLDCAAISSNTRGLVKPK